MITESSSFRKSAKDLQNQMKTWLINSEIQLKNVNKEPKFSDKVHLIQIRGAVWTQ
jgi:hypothetical protein